MVKVKICGLRRLQDIEIVNKYKPDFIGFVFAKSKRQVSLEEAKRLKQALSKEIKAVGVFVNEPLENIRRCADEGVIDCVQLHGDESKEEIEKLKRFVNVPIIKALRVESKCQIKRALQELKEAPIDYYLFDTYHHNVYGGMGRSFDWKILSELSELDEIQKPYFLAGGIGCENIQVALKVKPFVIDLSSKVEVDGYKDETKIREIIQSIIIRGEDDE